MRAQTRMRTAERSKIRSEKAAEAASHKQENIEKMRARMASKAAKAAKKARGSAEFTQKLETAASQYRAMKDEAMDELAEDDAMDMVDAEKA